MISDEDYFHMRYKYSQKSQKHLKMWYEPPKVSIFVAQLCGTFRTPPVILMLTNCIEIYYLWKKITLQNFCKNIYPAVLIFNISNQNFLSDKLPELMIPERNFFKSDLSLDFLSQSWHHYCPHKHYILTQIIVTINSQVINHFPDKIFWGK